MNGKRKLSAVLLPLCLALSALPAGAADESQVLGGSAGFDDITGAANDSLASVSASVPAASVGSIWNCAVTCSVEATHESGTGHGRVLILDDGVEVAGTGRRFEINDNAGINDLSPIVVSTTGVTTISSTSDPDALACAAHEDPAEGDQGDFDVNDSSISVVCTDLP